MLGAVLLTPEVSAQTHSSTLAKELSRIPLADALFKLQEETGISLYYNADLVQGFTTPSLTLEDAAPEQILRRLLEGSDLYYFRLSSGTYAIKAVEANIPPLSGSLEGYVYDNLTGDPLPGAHVFLQDTEIGTVVNRSGLFQFKSLPPGEYNVYASYVGFTPQVIPLVIAPGKNEEIRVELLPEPVALNPITVEDNRDVARLDILSNTTIGEPIARMNALGTADAVRSLDVLTGVRVGDAKADIHIQGGESGEHQFLLDGVPVFEPVHLHGLVGAFNPYALQRITVHKAGFGVSQGSHLSGVINAEHVLASPQGQSLDIQVDQLSLNARTHFRVGPKDGTQAQFMLAYRTSLRDITGYSPQYLDDLLEHWNAPDDFIMRATLLAYREKNFLFNYEEAVARLDSIAPPGIPKLGYNDFHAAGQLRLAGDQSIHASFYRGSNELTTTRLVAGSTNSDSVFSDPDVYDWINANAQVRYTALLGSRLYLTSRLRNSVYRLAHEYKALDNDPEKGQTFRIGDDRYFLRYDLTPADDGNRIQEFGFETTLDFAHRFGSAQFGFESARSSHRFSIEDVFFRSILHASTDWRLAVFGEENVSLGSKTRLSGGVRLTYLRQRKTIYAEPRLEVRFDQPRTPLGDLSLRFATGIYRQYLNQFDISSISPSAIFPSIRFWMPVDSTVSPPKAYHFASDILLKPSEQWLFRVEGYYKHQPHLLRIDYPTLWNSDLETPQDSLALVQGDFLQSSRGFAYGGAFSIEHTTAFSRSIVRYEHNIAEREYVLGDSTQFAAVPWSEPHRIELALDLIPHPRLVFTSRWRGGWGRTWGYRRAYYDFLGSSPTFEPVFGDVDLRDPTSHKRNTFMQLDLGAAYTHYFGPSAFQLRVDVLNVTNRNNVADSSLQEQQPVASSEFVTQNRHLLARTVSLALRFRW